MGVPEQMVGGERNHRIVLSRFAVKRLISAAVLAVVFCGQAVQGQEPASVPSDAVTVVLPISRWADDVARGPFVIEGHWFRIDAEQASEGPVRCNISEAAFLRYVYEDGQSFPELSSDGTDWSRDFGFAVSGLRLVPGAFDCVRRATRTEEDVPIAGADASAPRRTVREVYRWREQELRLTSRMAEERMEVAVSVGANEEVLARETAPNALGVAAIKNFRVLLAGDVNRDGAVDLLVLISHGETGRAVLLMSGTPDGSLQRVAEVVY